MEIPNCWSELPFDILTSIFQQLSFVDFQRAKIVCPNWFLASKVIKKKESPWLMLFPKEKSNCVLYNPELNQFYNPVIDYPRYRFLANSGKWFLVVTPEYNLSIIDLFSSERINLPPLESLVTHRNNNLRRVGDKRFQYVPLDDLSDQSCAIYDVDTIHGLLWVDEKNKANYAVIWYFYFAGSDCPRTVVFCKNGYDKYVSIAIDEFLLISVLPSRLLQLKDYKLYIHTSHSKVAIVDLSDETFPYITRYETDQLRSNRTRHLTVTSSGEVLVVIGIRKRARAWSKYPPKISTFKIYKDDPDIEVESLGSDEEALLIDLGVTTSVKDVPGIEPNSIYFTRHHNLEGKLDICVFNLATKTFKRFPNLSDISLNDARWFIPTLG